MVMVHDTNKIKPELSSFGSEDNHILYKEWLSAEGSTIEVRIDSKKWMDSLLADFEKLAKAMLDDTSRKLNISPCSLSLFLCDDERIQHLNYYFKQINKPTNVLSFSSLEPGDKNYNQAQASIGDIAIAHETVKREADELGISFIDHLTHLFVHGALHLLGYDHFEDDMAKKMETLEIELLHGIGIENPYQESQIGTKNNGGVA